MPAETPLAISVQELRGLIAAAEIPYLLDVREADEHAACHMAGAVLVPLSLLSARGPAALPRDLPKDRLVVCYCKMGARSAQVTQWLRQQGYDNIRNLDGGMDAWAAETDTR